MATYKTDHGDSNFDEAFSEVMKFEGTVVSDDPDDPGGLTVCGIAYNYNKSWSGWANIRAGLSNGSIKLKKNLPTSYVEEDIADYYYENYWLRYGCDLVSGSLGKEMFDQAVNPGPAVMVKNLQMCLNIVNYNANTKTKMYEDDLVVDGKWGKNTRTRLIDLGKKYNKLLTEAMNSMQAYYYINLATNSIAKRKYVKGWLTRTTSTTA